MMEAIEDEPRAILMNKISSAFGIILLIITICLIKPALQYLTALLE